MFIFTLYCQINILVLTGAVLDYVRSERSVSPARWWKLSVTRIPSSSLTLLLLRSYFKACIHTVMKITYITFWLDTEVT